MICAVSVSLSNSQTFHHKKHFFLYFLPWSPGFNGLFTMKQAVLFRFPIFIHQRHKEPSIGVSDQVEITGITTESQGT